MTKCITKYCRGKREKDHLKCSKCRSREFAQKHPEKYFFNALRNNANRRGKEFKLTLHEFIRFCNETDYLDKKGKDRDSLTIDRIDNDKGYEYSNLQALTLAANSVKESLRRKYKSQEPDFSDLPF